MTFLSYFVNQNPRGVNFFTTITPPIVFKVINHLLYTSNSLENIQMICVKLMITLWTLLVIVLEDCDDHSLGSPFPLPPRDYLFDYTPWTISRSPLWLHRRSDKELSPLWLRLRPRSITLLAFRCLWNLFPVTLLCICPFLCIIFNSCGAKENLLYTTILYWTVLYFSHPIHFLRPPWLRWWLNWHVLNSVVFLSVLWQISLLCFSPFLCLSYYCLS